MTSDPTPKQDEFYIHYASIPSGYRQFLLRFIPLLMLGAVVFALVLPRCSQSI